MTRGQSTARDPLIYSAPVRAGRHAHGMLGACVMHACIASGTRSR